MTSESPRTPSYASPPFDNLRADLIVRSSDAIDFRVSSFILGMSSDIFSSMLDACQANSGDTRDGCPIVQLQENSGTLDCLLRIIYPRKTPPLDDLQSIPPVLYAALKYDMEKAVEVVSGALRSFIPKDPVRVWCIAVRGRLEAEARAAADEMNRRSLNVLDLAPPELQDIHAGAYYRLLRYRRKRGSVEPNFTFCDPPRSQIISPTATVFEQDQKFISPSHQRVRSFADMMCRSSDAVDIPAHRVLLALASPLLGGMVASLPLPGVTVGEVAGGVEHSFDLPILPFEVDATTLRTLLALCYPGAEASDSVNHYPVVRKVSDALKEYDMGDATTLLNRRWSQLLKTDPLQAYLLAVQHGASTEAKEAEEQLLALNRNMHEYYAVAMETTPATMYRALRLKIRTEGSERGWLSESEEHEVPDSRRTRLCKKCRRRF